MDYTKLIEKTLNEYLKEALQNKKIADNNLENAIYYAEQDDYLDHDYIYILKQARKLLLQC